MTAAAVTRRPMMVGHNEGGSAAVYYKPAAQIHEQRWYHGVFNLVLFAGRGFLVPAAGCGQIRGDVIRFIPWAGGFDSRSITVNPK